MQKWQVLKGVLTKVEELILGIIVHVTTNKSLPGKATNDPFSKLHVFSVGTVTHQLHSDLCTDR